MNTFGNLSGLYSIVAKLMIVDSVLASRHATSRAQCDFSRLTPCVWRETARESVFLSGLLQVAGGETKNIAALGPSAWLKSNQDAIHEVEASADNDTLTMKRFICINTVHLCARDFITSKEYRGTCCCRDTSRALDILSCMCHTGFLKSEVALRFGKEKSRRLTPHSPPPPPHTHTRAHTYTCISCHYCRAGSIA